MKEDFKEKMREASEKEIQRTLDLKLGYNMEAIAETFTKEFLEFEQEPHSMGFKICKAYLNKDVDAMLEALCGDCMDTILETAGILDPFEERMVKIVGSIKEDNSLNNDCGDEKQTGEYTPSAELIAKFIAEEGLENTTTGKWLMLYDAIDDAFGVWLPHNKALLANVLQRLKEDYSEVIAEVDAETWELGIAVYYYADRCPNVVLSKMEIPTEERKN